MFERDWDEGCIRCSFWADNYNGIFVHLRACDVQLVTVSAADSEKLSSYKQRMGWDFPWVSCGGNEFGKDFGVSFDQSGEVLYNYKMQHYPCKEAPGFSVFYQDDEGTIFHTYSCYARGLDAMNTAYQILDMVPKGRDGDDLPCKMDWLKRHDSY
eukprot:TRINITY_DN11256_c0_g1_i1.p1 TRINITY_DN11256_c0_g1~~TRINITY_DN11256_c0_g1_i1.p1  ORF type:complete len:155 (-),score=29.90 TRINITY_DN11256_c0_g1_i1:46-510(-)